MAAKEGLSAQALCDKCTSWFSLRQNVVSYSQLMPSSFADHKLHAEAYEWFEIGFDHFGRTSTPKQTE